MSGSQPRRLGDVIEQLIVSMQAGGLKPATIISSRQTYDHFLAHVGNVQIKSVRPDHIDKFMADRQSRGEANATLGIRRMWIRKLFNFAVTRRLITVDPSANMAKYRKQTLTPKTYIPASEFPALLDAAPDAVSRITVAIGLYAFLRAGEIATLRVGDVDLDRRRLLIKRHKTEELDWMPISTELDAELRRWLTVYTEDQGGLEPGMYLTPRRTKLMPRPQADGTYRPQLSPGQKVHLPYAKMMHPHYRAQETLAAAGYALRSEPDNQGRTRSLREGGHTLRRSGARALYDRLREEGTHDDVNRYIQAMLGHKAFTTTEIYLGLSADRAKRDDLIAGKPMFPVAADNVVPLRRVEKEK